MTKADELLITIRALREQLTSLKRRYEFVKDIVFTYPEACRDYFEQVYPMEVSTMNKESFNIAVERDGVVFDVEGTWAYADPAYRDYGEVVDYTIYHTNQIITEFLDDDLVALLVDEAAQRHLQND